MSKIKGQYRQGDVLIQEVSLDKINLAEAKEVARDEYGRIVLAYGEATGHAHVVVDPAVVMLAFNDEQYLYNPDKTPFELRHELPGGQPTGDHDWINVKPATSGLFKVVRQREYTPQAFRTVMD
jgi:hypothetical protein